MLGAADKPAVKRLIQGRGSERDPLYPGGLFANDDPGRNRTATQSTRHQAKPLLYV